MKRFLTLCLTLVMCVSLAACGDSSETANTGATVKLKVWCSKEQEKLTKNLLEEFKKENTDKNYDFKIGIVGENNAQAKIQEDSKAAADVFAFAGDHLYPLIDSGFLYEITKDKDEISKNNLDFTVDAAIRDGKLYAYPITSDNGYMMYYDKSVFSEEDVKSFEKMLEVAQSKDKKVQMDIGNAWFTAAFFIGNGCTIKLDETGKKQIVDFNNAKGVEAGEAIKAITANKAYIAGNDELLTGNIGKNIAAGISGTWVSAAIKEKLGDNYGVAKLPTVKMGGKDVQLGSFASAKLMGVSSQTKYPLEALAVANYLTTEKSQLARYKAVGAAPSNIKASENADVKADVTLAALAEQAKFGVAQKEVTGNFWVPLGGFGTKMISKKYDKTVKEELDGVVAQMQK